MAVGDAYVFLGFLTPVLTQLFFPKPPTTFLTCFCRGERRKYAGKKSRLNRGSNSQPPGHESDTLTTEPPGRGRHFKDSFSVSLVKYHGIGKSRYVYYSKFAKDHFFLVNPFPNKPWFLRVCSTSLLKTLWEKEKLLVTSNFSFSQGVFYPFGELSAICILLKLVFCKLFQFGRV